MHKLSPYLAAGPEHRWANEWPFVYKFPFEINMRLNCFSIIVWLRFVGMKLVSRRNMYSTVES